MTAKSCCFLPLGLRGDTVSFAASPDAHHKVTGCSKEIYIELASFTSDTAIPFVSLSSQLRSLKPAPKTIFFLIHLAEALTLLFHAVLLQKYISFNRVFKTQGVSFYYYF